MEVQVAEVAASVQVPEIAAAAPTFTPHEAAFAMADAASSMPLMPSMPRLADSACFSSVCIGLRGAECLDTTIRTCRPFVCVCL
jgi:hypothetical protein